MKSADNKFEPVYLATTALEDFWDSGQPIVFLGDWCTLYSRREIWSKLDYRILKTPYGSSNIGEEIYAHVNCVYEKILPVLGRKLNVIHGSEHGERYWRIVIGPWLQWYLPTLYDHYLHLKQALGQYRNVSTVGLAPESFVTPNDTMDFIELKKGDFYNLQMYTRILSFLGLDFPSKAAEPIQQKARDTPQKGPLLKNSIRSCISALIQTIASHRGTINLHASYFRKSEMVKLIVSSLGRVIPISTQMLVAPQAVYDREKREVLRNWEFGETEFERCVSALIFLDVPLIFVEGFSFTRSAAHERYTISSRHVIFSSNSWYFDEVFKQWAALCAEAGSLILGTQHGGCYGTLQSKIAEDHETEIADYYYSWGWERTNCRAKVIPMPATNFCGVQEIGADNRKSGVLFAATTEARYILEFPRLPEHLPEYFDRQIRFLRSLPKELLGVLRFRAHYEDHGWCALERLKDAKVDVIFESWSISFLQSLEECRLYVCDHLSTTYAQALALNKPTVLFFYSEQTTLLRSEAKPYFQLLQDAGILYETPEAAASALGAIYEDVEGWWNAPYRQDAVQNFCYRYARTSPDSISKWNAELSRISRLTSKRPQNIH